MTDLKTAIRQFVVDNFLFGQGDTLTDTASFLDEGIIDSTGVLQVVAFLEETFALSVSDSELTLENLDSIEAIAAFVAKRRSTIPAVSRLET